MASCYGQIVVIGLLFYAVLSVGQSQRVILPTVGYAKTLNGQAKLGNLCLNSFGDFTSSNFTPGCPLGIFFRTSPNYCQMQSNVQVLPTWFTQWSSFQFEYFQTDQLTLDLSYIGPGSGVIKQSTGSLSPDKTTFVATSSTSFVSWPASQCRRIIDSSGSVFVDSNSTHYTELTPLYNGLADYACLTANSTYIFELVDKPVPSTNSSYCFTASSVSTEFSQFQLKAPIVVPGLNVVSTMKDYLKIHPQHLIDNNYEVYNIGPGYLIVPKWTANKWANTTALMYPFQLTGSLTMISCNSRVRFYCSGQLVQGGLGWGSNCLWSDGVSQGKTSPYGQASIGYWIDNSPQPECTKIDGFCTLSGCQISNDYSAWRGSNPVPTSTTTPSTTTASTTTTQSTTTEPTTQQEWTTGFAEEYNATDPAPFCIANICSPLWKSLTKEILKKGLECLLK